MIGTTFTQAPPITAAEITDQTAVTVIVSVPSLHADFQMTVQELKKLIGLDKGTTAQRTALAGMLAAADDGYLFWDTDEKVMYQWDGAQWI